MRGPHRSICYVLRLLLVYLLPGHTYYARELIRSNDSSEYGTYRTVVYENTVLLQHAAAVVYDTNGRHRVQSARARARRCQRIAAIPGTYLLAANRIDTRIAAASLAWVQYYARYATSEQCAVTRRRRARFTPASTPPRRRVGQYLADVRRCGAASCATRRRASPPLSPRSRQSAGARARQAAP